MADYSFRSTRHHCYRCGRGHHRHRCAGGRSQPGRQRLCAERHHPETDTTCHYFWAFMRNYALHDQSLTTLTREGVTGVFGEDEAVLEAQQRAIGAHPDHAFYNSTSMPAACGRGA
nr:hypothetical protein [Xanthomonas vasicola]